MEIYTVSGDRLWVPRRWQLKERERNLVSAMMGIFVIVILATALSQPRWFALKGGGCSQKYLGVQYFFSFGQFQTQVPPIVQFGRAESHRPSSLVYLSQGNVALYDCVTPKIVGLMKTNIVLCLSAIVCSLIQFLWDSLGLRNKKAIILRRIGVGSILTVIICVGVIGCTYYIATLLEIEQEKSKKNPGTKIEIKFDISYYLITAAGALAILTAGANLLKQYPNIADSDDGENLLDDQDGSETFSIGNTHCQLWPCRSSSRSRGEGSRPSFRRSVNSTPNSINFSGILPSGPGYNHAPPPPYAP